MRAVYDVNFSVERVEYVPFLPLCGMLVLFDVVYVHIYTRDEHEEVEFE